MIFSHAFIVKWLLHASDRSKQMLTTLSSNALVTPSWCENSKFIGIHPKPIKGQASVGHSLPIYSKLLVETSNYCTIITRYLKLNLECKIWQHNAHIVFYNKFALLRNVMVKSHAPAVYCHLPYKNSHLAKKPLLSSRDQLSLDCTRHNKYAPYLL